jgi:hypothetical protein
MDKQVSEERKTLAVGCGKRLIELKRMAKVLTDPEASNERSGFAHGAQKM